MLNALLLCLLLLPAAATTVGVPPAPPAESASAELPTLLQSQATAQPAAEAPTTQPTTQPAAAGEGQIDLLKVFKGEQKLTAEQLVEFGPWVNAITTICFAVLAFIPRLFVAVVLLTLFYLIYRALRRMIVGGMRKAKVDDSICDMLQSMLKWGILGFGMIVACSGMARPSRNSLLVELRNQPLPRTMA